MLGSIQKYRPAKKPEPYNANTIRQLQGITTPRASGTMRVNSVGRKGIFLDNSLLRPNPTNLMTLQTPNTTGMSRLLSKGQETAKVSILQTRRSTSVTKEFLGSMKGTPNRSSIGTSRQDGLQSTRNKKQFQTVDYIKQVNMETTSRGPSESFGRGNVHMPIGAPTETIDHSFMGTEKDQVHQTQLADQQRAHTFFDSKQIWRRNTVNETLYDGLEGSHRNQLGLSFNTKMRDADQFVKGRMNFGSPMKYSGQHEKHRGLNSNLPIEPCDINQKAQNQIGSAGQTATSWRSSGGAKTQIAGTGRSQSIKVNTNKELPPAINNMLEREYADPQNLLESDICSGKKDDNLLSDTYLPVLRNFVTTQRVKVPVSEEVVSQFKKAQAIDKQRAHVPKLIAREAINKKTESSLYSRQRDILMRAQMQNPANKSQKQTMKETHIKDWVMNEIEGKINGKEAISLKLNPQADRSEKDKYSNNQSSGSSDNYDPLADSDCSSAGSDSPNKLSGAELQEVIKEQMRGRVTIKNIPKGFWKGLVSMSDPDVTLDEEGNPIEVMNKPSLRRDITSFQMIKKMMRLKKKQENLPESEKVKNFIPKVFPDFMSDGKEKANLMKNQTKQKIPSNKYYFDLKNNKEHYHMLTNDMTDEEYSVFEERERSRVDELHHSRKLMASLVEKRLEQYRQAKAEREATKNRKIEVEKLGEYRSKKTQMEENKIFQDDDDLLHLQVLMDTSERKEMADAIKAHVSKQHNRKAMLCPQRELKLSDFARDIVDGMIWDHVKEHKVHPRVLFKMEAQTDMGIMVNKALLRKREIEKLNKILSDKDGRQSELKVEASEKENRDKEYHSKDLFIVSHKKAQFFEAAKQIVNSNVLPTSNVNMPSFKRFYEKCQQSGTLAMPIFSNCQNQVLSIVGQYISPGMASAMSEVLRRIMPDRKGNKPHAGHDHALDFDVKEEEVAYIVIKEINLDDNGLKDAAFADILSALATQPSLKRISYVNNEIGQKSILQLEKILSHDHEGELQDIRITRVKSTKHDLKMLLESLSKCTNRLIRLRLSHVALDEFVLMESLQTMVNSMPHIQELNLSNINIHGWQLSDIMEVISENCQQMQYLNLSYNSLPQQEKYQAKFMQHLVNMIQHASKLIDIDLSGMNFRGNVKQIQWPLAKSKTLQSIHLSDNYIPRAIEINMLMVFGVKSLDDASDGFSITGKLDPRQLKRSLLTSFNVQMQHKLENLVEGFDHGSRQTTPADEQFSQLTSQDNMLQTYEDATARIANAIEIRDLKNEKNYHNSCMQGGLGRQNATNQPLVISRRLGHPELIFNNTDSKNTHFMVNAQAKWVRNQGNECWICDSWKYAVIFFSRSQWNQNYSEILDAERIQQLQEMYDLEQEDLLMVDNKDFPLILGGITKNIAVSMIDISMFNLFLDEQKIKKDMGGQGERALRTILTVSQGMKNTFGNKLKILPSADWLTRFKRNLPFEEKEMCIANLPTTRLSKKVESGAELTKSEQAQRKEESQTDVYVFAGYVEPGKHQIVIKDQKTDRWFSREIVVEARRREIIECNQVQLEKTSESIKRFQRNDNMGATTTMIDLDSSVFMNFKRYTKQDVDNCFKSDMRHSSFENVIKNEQDLQECLTIYKTNYAAYCQFFHEMAAQLDEFPLIDLVDLPKVLYSICMMGMPKAERVSKACIEKFRATAAANEQPCEEQILLNRVRFAEVLLSVLYFDEQDASSPAKKQAQLDMEAIPEDEEEGVIPAAPTVEDYDENFKFHFPLQNMLKKFIVPSLEDKNEETMPVSLNAFRNRFCWVEKVNAILELNLEGIMEVFGKFMEDVGFTMTSAEKVLKGIGCLLPPRTQAMLFDLSQMTVIDESENAEEYDDMELVEFLEFLVRVAYHTYLGEDRNITEKVSDLLTSVLQLSNIVFIEGPKNHSYESQASDEDIQAFHKYMQKNILF